MPIKSFLFAWETQVAVFLSILNCKIFGRIAYLDDDKLPLSELLLNHSLVCSGLFPTELFSISSAAQKQCFLVAFIHSQTVSFCFPEHPTSMSIVIPAVVLKLRRFRKFGAPKKL